MGDEGYGSLQAAMVDRMVEREVIRSVGVERAFRAVPRHLFVPGVSLEEAYQNNAIPTKRDVDGKAISSSSQPTMMAIMLEQLGLERGQRVLEVGAGTGFNAALMGHIVGETGQVTTIDIDLDIVEGARAHLAAAGVENVTVVLGDGTLGYAANGPYDAIILTVGGWDIAPAWVEQLAENGRLLLPLSLNGPQFSIAFEREGGQTGVMVSRSIVACSFMVLRGEFAGPMRVAALPGLEGADIVYQRADERPSDIDPAKVADWLGGVGEDKAEDASEDVAVDLQVSQVDVWQGLNLWLALNEPELVLMGGRGEGLAALPVLIGKGDAWGMTMGLVGEEGMAFLVRPSGDEAADEETAEKRPFQLHIRRYGEAEGLTERLRGHVMAWEANGRPGTEGMRVRAYPVGEAVEGVIVNGRWHQFVIDWPEA